MVPEHVWVDGKSILQPEDLEATPAVEALRYGRRPGKYCNDEGTMHGILFPV